MKIEKNKSLLPYNTFGVDVNCSSFYEFKSCEELQKLRVEQRDLMSKYMVIGSGSNILFINDYNGLILHSKIKGIHIENKTDDQVVVRVGSGEIWDDFVDWSVSENLGGAENLSLIPGAIGASAVQNIGAYGVEFKDLVKYVEGVNIRTGENYRLSMSECKYSYRDSIFKHELNRFIVTHVGMCLDKHPKFNIDYGSVRAELEKEDEINLQTIRKTIIYIRNGKIPKPEVIKSAGSFFKNPIVSLEYWENLKTKFTDIPHFIVDNGIKIPAGWMIEQCGWKGKRFGDVGIHENQALVIVNYGNASGQEIYQLSMEVEDSVLNTFGIELEREVIIIK